MTNTIRILAVIALGIISAPTMGDAIHDHGQAYQQRIIVELKTAAAPEGLLSLQRREQQQQMIAGVQRRILDRTTVNNPLISVVRRYEHLPMMALVVDEDGLEALANDPEVLSIQHDHRFRPLLEQSIPLIHAPELWAAGGRGQDWAVAILDTGVDKNHPFIAGRVVAEACFSTNFSSNKASSVCPDRAENSVQIDSGVHCNLSISGCDHGTHAAGIASGYLNEGKAGTAPSSGIIAIQVFTRIDDANYCGGPAHTPCAASYVSDQLAAMEWLLTLQADPDSHFRIAAANMSLGGARIFDNEAECDSANPALRRAVENLRAVNVATIIAAGNEASSIGLSAPGCLSSAIAVGATDKSDQLASWTNHSDLVDILAPGVSILSAVAGGGYQSFSGTSMAAPHVAGAWAALMSRYPDASVDDVQLAIQSSGVPISTRAPTKPRIDMLAAHTELQQISATIQVLLEPEEARTSGAAWRIQGSEDTRWYSSGEQIRRLTPHTEYTLEFLELDDTIWFNPEPLTIETADGLLSLTTTYELVPPPEPEEQKGGGGASGLWLWLLCVVIYRLTRRVPMREPAVWPHP